MSTKIHKRVHELLVELWPLKILSVEYWFLCFAFGQDENGNWNCQIEWETQDIPWKNVATPFVWSPIQGCSYVYAGLLHNPPSPRLHNNTAIYFFIVFFNMLRFIAYLKLLSALFASKKTRCRWYYPLVHFSTLERDASERVSISHDPVGNGFAGRIRRRNCSQIIREQRDDE